MCRWLVSLKQLHLRLRPHFARPEPYQHALLSLQAVLSEIPRKNGWQIAEHARLSRPYAIQRLLSHATWDEDGVRDELRALVSQMLNPLPSVSEHCASETPFPVLVIDESGFPKRGRHSAGVAPQYCGLTGRVENCQVGVFLSYVTALSHARISRELYLPEDWCSDLPRRQAAHIPDRVRFRTKPELACLSAGSWLIPFTAIALTCASSSKSKATPTRWPSLAPKSFACKAEQVFCSVMSPVSRSRRCVPAIGSASLPAWAPKASASLTGLACRSCALARWTVVTSS